MDLTNLLLTIPAITATVQWLKSLGVTGKWAQATAVICGVVFAYLTYFTRYAQLDAYTLDLWIKIGVEGFLYGLAASGFYDLANGNLKPHTPESSLQATPTLTRHTGRHHNTRE